MRIMKLFIIFFVLWITMARLQYVFVAVVMEPPSSTLVLHYILLTQLYSFDTATLFTQFTQKYMYYSFLKQIS